jgi:hypothetical protein
VDAVYRRWLIVHLFEQIGQGMLLGSALAIALLLLAVWQVMPTLPILLFSGVFGLFVGLVLSLYRKPTRLAAAVEADRQLRLDDLLTSAIYTSDRTDADFNAIVKTMADARCARHSPSEVMLRRFGIRSWSGIALAMSIAVTLAVIPLQPSRSQAVDANLSVLSASTTPPAQTSQVDREFVPVVNNPTSDSASNTAMSSEISDTNPASNSQPAQSPAASAGRNASGTGGGKSETASTPGRDLPPGAAVGRTTGQTGTAASGATTADRQNANANSPTSSAGASAKPTSPVPNWSGDAKANSPDTGSSTTDRIPAEDRDLVRDFFRR